ncbi:hypothetical protein ACWEWI_33050 [Streptomyces sp. NPDC003753]|nr:hypothetical protein [Streptomyces sp. Y2F8-2]
MPGRPGLVLSLTTASQGGNTLSATVGHDHQCDSRDGGTAG